MTSQVKVKRARWRWDRDLTSFVLQNWKLSKIKQKPETEPVTHQEDHCLAFKFTIYYSCRSKSIKETRQCYWTIGGFNFTTYNTCKKTTTIKTIKEWLLFLYDFNHNFYWTIILPWGTAHFSVGFILVTQINNKNSWVTVLTLGPIVCIHPLHSKLGFLLFLTGSLNSNTALLLKLAKCQKDPSGHSVSNFAADYGQSKCSLSCLLLTTALMYLKHFKTTSWI